MNTTNEIHPFPPSIQYEYKQDSYPPVGHVIYNNQLNRRIRPWEQGEMIKQNKAVERKKKKIEQIPDMTYITRYILPGSDFLSHLFFPIPCVCVVLFKTKKGILPSWHNVGRINHYLNKYNILVLKDSFYRCKYVLFFSIPVDLHCSIW